MAWRSGIYEVDMFSKEITQHQSSATPAIHQQDASSTPNSLPPLVFNSTESLGELPSDPKKQTKTFKAIDTWIASSTSKPGKAYLDEYGRPLTGIVARETKNTVKVTICHNGYHCNTYTYYKLPQAPKHPMVSWKNITMCGGYCLSDENGQRTDRSEDIANAVFIGTKPVGDLYYANETDAQAMTLTASQTGLEVINYQTICKYTNSTSYRMLIGVHEPVGELFDLNAIAAYYTAVVPWSSDSIRKKFHQIRLMTPAKVLRQYDFFNPASDAEYAVTGMLLGYPFESTGYLLR
jgi:hypothetical protein